MRLRFLLCLGLALSALGANAQWMGYANDPQHTGISATPLQPLSKILWQTGVDDSVQTHLIHYGTMLVTPGNTVLVTVKTGANDGFRMDARRGRDGVLIWTQATDYSLPAAGWTPSCGSTITPQGKVAIPGAGGTVYLRDNLDSASGTVTQVCFYGMSAYQADAAAFNSTVKISTPITTDCEGNIYFGFRVSGANPANLVSGMARITPYGFGTMISAANAAQDANIVKVQTNCAPAISNDGAIVYVGVSDGGGGGYLVGLNSTTLQPVYRVRCKDPRNGTSDMYLHSDGTSSPTVGPDGDVYFGCWSNNNYRGFMLHYDRTLTVTKTPGSFGWDDTSSIVPRAAVPSYVGTSKYLILTKYNNYIEAGAPGDNKLAVLDPNGTQIDPISGAVTMKEILTVLGPTHDPRGGPDARIEWCINTAAIDPVTKCALVNSEDGTCYRWDFATNSIGEFMPLNNGVGEAYTPTAVGPDGTGYIINNHVMYAISRAPTLANLTLSLDALRGGNSMTGMVTLTAPAATGGANVVLSSSNPAVATVPSLLTIVQGTPARTFPINTFAVANSTNVTITATRAGISRSATFRVTATAALKSLTCQPGVIAGGNPVSVGILLSQVAPVGGAQVSLVSSNPALASIPESITIPYAASTGSVVATTGVTQTTQSVTFTGTRDGVTRSVVLSVTKLPALSSLSTGWNTATGGSTIAASVSISANAPAGGANVLLSTDNPAATVPGLVNIAANTQTKPFEITTIPVVCDTKVTLTATRAGLTRTAQFTVLAPVVDSILVNPLAIQGGQHSMATIMLTGPAGPNGVVVELLSSNSAATIIASVLIPAGQISANVDIATTAVAQSQSVVITGRKAVVKTANLTINP